MRWVFNLGYLWLAAWIWPWFVFKYLTTGKYRAGIGQRLGALPERKDGRKSIWVHAVSVGELLQIKPLLKALRQRHPEHDGRHVHHAHGRGDCRPGASGLLPLLFAAGLELGSRRLLSHSRPGVDRAG